MAGILPEPYEYLDLHPGASITLRITAYEAGEADIHPRAITPRHVRTMMQQLVLTEPPVAGAPIVVRVPVLRVTAERLDSPSPVSYYDISSKRLQALLLPLLSGSPGLPLSVTITAYGQRPEKVYGVRLF